MKTKDLEEARLVSLKFNDNPLVEEVDVFTGEEIDASQAMEGFKFLSIVKETGVDNQGLNEFATDYFPYPSYKDQARVFYTALGSGKMSFNPLGLIKLIRDSMKRIKESGVKSYNMKGEGLIQGGWILFDANGIPKAAFQENAKERIPIDDILLEMQRMKDSK
eukprot:g8220.t1 g8220   contig29:30129-30882(+)